MKAGETITVCDIEVRIISITPKKKFNIISIIIEYNNKEGLRIRRRFDFTGVSIKNDDYVISVIELYLNKYGSD